MLALVASTLPNRLAVHGTGSVQLVRGRARRTLQEAIGRYDRQLRDGAGLNEEYRKIVNEILAIRFGVRPIMMAGEVSPPWPGADLIVGAFGSPVPDPQRAGSPTRWLRDTLSVMSAGDLMPGFALVAAQAEGYARRALAADQHVVARLALRDAVTNALATRWGLDHERARQSLDAWETTVGLVPVAQLQTERSPSTVTIALSQSEVRNPKPRLSTGQRSRRPGAMPTDGPAVSAGVVAVPHHANAPGFSVRVAPTLAVDVPEPSTQIRDRKAVPRTVPGLEPVTVDDHVRSVASDGLALTSPSDRVVPDNSAAREHAFSALDAIPTLPSPRVAAALAILSLGHCYTMYWLWQTWPTAYRGEDRPPSRLYTTLGSAIPIIGWVIVLDRARRIERAFMTEPIVFKFRALLQASLYTTFAVLILMDSLWIEAAGLACVGAMAATASQTAVIARQVHADAGSGSPLPKVLAWVLGATWLVLVASHLTLP